MSRECTYDIICSVINDYHSRVTLFINQVRRHHSDDRSKRKYADQCIVTLEKFADKLRALLWKPENVIATIIMLCWHIYLYFGHPLFYPAGYFDAVPRDGDNSHFCNHNAMLAETKRGNNLLHVSKR